MTNMTSLLLFSTIYDIILTNENDFITHVNAFSQRKKDMMGLFDKKYCDICGEKIGLLGNKKLEDGNICKHCAKKLSPWFEDRRHSTLDEIKQQLQYREDNKKNVAAFEISRQYEGSYDKLFIDRKHGWFAIGHDVKDEEANVDIIELSQIKNVHLDIAENREEERYRGEDGEYHSYSPRHYNYSYNYYVRIQVDSPWFDDLYIKLNTFEVKERERGQMRNYERMGDEIIEELQKQETVVEKVKPVESWTCRCGAVNTGKFCCECGAKRNQGPVHCTNCGWTAPDEELSPKFCPECGKPMK